ncbi:MAG: hypothetical protein EOP81_17870 [Variovorax sp.]|nr:MAG: hypothetical protein EOP81_17870 [Variovorax sp.]
MPQGLTPAKARAFLQGYDASRPQLQEAASQLQAYLTSVVSDGNIAPHMVSVRVKETDSVRGKLLRKDYSDPASELTDMIGARIILYHAAEVDHVASLLRPRLKIRERDSADKRLALGLREFGYRSYHLIGQIPRRLQTRQDLKTVGNLVFEIQVRSILEHVWAEIEHSVVYKSGADLPSELKRRFASLAAVLEMLEHEFSGVAEATEKLIDQAKDRLTTRPLVRQMLDAPTLLAMLEIEFPHALSFRAATRSSSAFPPAIEQRFLLALQRIRIRDSTAFLALIRTREFVASAKRYASSSGISVLEVSHLAVLAIALGLKSPDVLRVYFPEFEADGAMTSALRPIRRK